MLPFFSPFKSKERMEWHFGSTVAGRTPEDNSSTPQVRVVNGEERKGPFLVGACCMFAVGRQTVFL